MAVLQVVQLAEDLVLEVAPRLAELVAGFATIAARGQEARP